MKNHQLLWASNAKGTTLEKEIKELLVKTIELTKYSQDMFNVMFQFVPISLGRSGYRDYFWEVFITQPSLRLYLHFRQSLLFKIRILVSFIVLKSFFILFYKLTPPPPASLHAAWLSSQVLLFYRKKELIDPLSFIWTLHKLRQLFLVFSNVNSWLISFNQMGHQ